MEWTGLNELREKYLSFFESKGHLRLPGFPLVPQGDNTLLLINAGMAPMKKYFLGQEKPPASRVTTCQKCIRTPDIERVGKTARHGTYFEMLGNFSFGDYFKHEATAWAWEFVTKVLEMPVDRLWVTIYQDDDEALDIWTKEVGVAPERVVRFGREDNFWEHGALPCGPCSEIYFDRGEEYGCGKPECAVGCDCDRYVEFWNLVFQQFDSDGKGNYTRLKKPNIDTGMGLERLACILQNVDNLFEVDTIRNIMNAVSDVSGVKYGASEKTDVSLRVITDHIRSTVFMVADGVIPSNEGRGYVLRRLLRRAARHGRLLGIKDGFLAGLCDSVVRENHQAYPELADKKDYIKRVIGMEEERFAATIDQGLDLLATMTGKLEASGEKILPGADAFKLYDTFGFPIDLTKDILEEKSLSVDENGFDALMEEQRQKARAARAASGAGEAASVSDEDTPETVFTGYETLEGDAEIKAIIMAGTAGHAGERTGIVADGEKALFILDETPFYAESGGQVGDAGVLKTEKAVVKIIDCKKSPTGRFLHFGEVISGSVSLGDRVHAKVDSERRAAVMRNHSSAHLLQAALRRVLGSHVQQAGQLVNEKRVRFDFTHFSAMTEKELAAVEAEVNAAILSGLDVHTDVMEIEAAKKLGAMALFSEKYGKNVRVVKMGGYSMELCGGTHVSNTAKIGLFKIVSESSVAAGVRRIEGATGLNVLDVLNDYETETKLAASTLKCAVPELSARAEQLSAELKAKDRVIESLNGRIADEQIKSLVAGAAQENGIKLITGVFNGTAPDTLRLITDRIRDTYPDAAALIAGIRDGKLNFAACCGKEAVARGLNAGKIVKAAATVAGGGGGGRPESAMAGGRDVSKAEEALKTLRETATQALKG